MKNLMTFYGSCGHTVVEEIPVEQWNRMAGMTSEQLTRAHPLGLKVQESFWVECSDGSARMIYIYPLRYFNCTECMRAESDDPW